MKLRSFDDMLIVPKFSNIRSRKDVNLYSTFLDETISAPIISSNMDTVTEYKMAWAMHNNGGLACLHRFMSIEQNVEQYLKSPKNVFVSIGIGGLEYNRAIELHKHGAYNFIIDVAHGASIQVVEQYEKLKENLRDDCNIVVGNFATHNSIKEFNKVSKYPLQAIKVGIGSGSMCTTRIVTGCGIPLFESLLDCKEAGLPMIADGGIRNSGDIAKALAAGADLVMCGRLLAGTDESPGSVNYINAQENLYGAKKFKYYRGSASKESYKVQNKTASHRTPEGESTTVEYTGSVENVLNSLTAGLKSAMSYVGANNLYEFKELVEFVEVTISSHKESTAHGK